VNARALGLLLVVLTAANARADNTADEADIAFSLGNEAYAKRDYDKALAAYFLSYRLVPNRNVLFNIAHCYEAQDRYDEAYRYWHDLFVDPSLPDSDRRDVGKALSRLSPRVALISVTTTPPGAELYVDRRDLGSRGRTPQTIAVTPGSHTLLVDLAGHEPGEAKVSTSKGREAKTEVVLTRIEGKVTLTGTPVGAAIRETADGPELGRVPATLAFLPGQHLLVVTAADHLPQQVLVDVKPRQTITASVALPDKPKPTGKVVVRANRDGAVVTVDGKEFGFTPTVVTLTEGEHDLEVTASDAKPFTQHLTVAADSNEQLFVDLRYAPPKVAAVSKSALSVDQAPASVTVITNEELRAFGYQSLAEALAGVRGMFLTDDRLYTYVGIRGFQPPGDFNTRLLVLWDGHPFNDVWTGQGYAAREFDVDLSEVERLEVVRGPASILFGTGALFGVINVVPRDTLAGRHVEGVAGAGGLNGVKARVTGSLGSDRRSVLVSAAGFNSQGAELTSLPPVGDVQGLDGERSLGASVRAKFDDFSVVAKLNQRRKQAPTAPHGSVFGVPGTEYTDVRGFAELRWEHAWSRVTLDARASYDASRFRGYYAQLDDQNARFRTTDTGGADWFSAEARAGISLFGSNRLSLSLEGSGQFVYQQAIDLPNDPHNRLLLSGTVLDEWQLHPRLFMQLGVRVDKYNDIESVALSPRGALVAKLYDSGITKLIGGRAFRAPSVYELYFNDNYATQRVPLSPLKPEYITTVELEHSHDFTPELRLTVGGYFNYIEQLVITSDDPTPTPQCAGGTVCTVYGNSTDPLLAFGGEAQLRWRPGRYTLVDATYSFVTLSGVAQADYAYPRHQASLRGMFPLKEGLVRLSGQATYQSGRTDATGVTSGEALLLNVGLSGEYGVLRYFAGIQNLLDSRYTLPVQSEIGNVRVPQYGRTFWIEVAAGF
jgi:outer membrane receptor for ferrienterochelin and colicins